jgi:hypothetical protein
MKVVDGPGKRKTGRHQREADSEIEQSMRPPSCTGRRPRWAYGGHGSAQPVDSVLCAGAGDGIMASASCESAHAVAETFPRDRFSSPFRLRAGMNTALDGTNPIFTRRPWYQDAPRHLRLLATRSYEPIATYKEAYLRRDVTARYAHRPCPCNNATVKMADEVGYDRVADKAKVVTGFHVGGGHCPPWRSALSMPTPATWRRPIPSSPNVRSGGHFLRLLVSTRCGNANGLHILSWTSKTRDTHTVLDPRVAIGL